VKKLLLGCILALVLSAIPLILLADNNTQIIDQSGNATIKGGYGVLTGVRIYGLIPGWSGTAPLIIMCDKTRDRLYDIHLESPDLDKLEAGYSALPEEEFSWIVISNSLVPAKAGETVRVPVTITIPSDIAYENRHDQIAFYVKDITQTGWNQIAYKVSWFLTTDAYDAYIPQEIPIAGKSVNTVLIVVIVVGALLAGCGVYLVIKARKGGAMPWQKS